MKTYIVAVSGGVDSVVLLHMLHSQHDANLIVAHFDHGIRDDSSDDADFVAGLADTYGLPFALGRAKLGSTASEATARRHRYAYLRKLKKEHAADSIVLAHHFDDKIETAIINVLRGTVRRGVVSLRSTQELYRPLLNMNKAELRDYALRHGLEFSEDSTNASHDYLRNRVRAQLYRSLNNDIRERLRGLFEQIESDTSEINRLVGSILQDTTNRMLRTDFDVIDAPVLYELVAEWLRKNDTTFDTNTIVRICNGARSLNPGAKIDVDKWNYCQVSRTEIILQKRTEVS